MSTIKVDNLQNRAGTASVPVDTVVAGSAKAWVNFNGTGTVAIRAAFNVSSITDNGTGTYTINFSTPMVDANFVFVSSITDDSTAARFSCESGTYGTNRTPSSCRFCVTNDTGVLNDAQGVYAAIFR